MCRERIEARSIGVKYDLYVMSYACFYLELSNHTCVLCGEMLVRLVLVIIYGSVVSHCSVYCSVSVPIGSLISHSSAAIIQS